MHIYQRRRAIWLFFLFFTCILTTNAYAKGYQGFSLLQEKDCVPLDKKAILQLPAEWHKYADFVKVCKMKEKKTSTEKVSFASIWANDYYKTQPPHAQWENFPRPLIVDKDFRHLGQLPELFPLDWITYLYVYYGKWKPGMPGEIRIDVHNPAVEGDYYYAPLTWNEKSGCYETKSTEVIYGRRGKCPVRAKYTCNETLNGSLFHTFHFKEEFYYV